MPVRVKICGTTNTRDALASVAAGADALGFVFYERSPRCVTIAAAAEIIRALPPFVSRVGVFVDAPEDFVRRAANDCGLDTLQFHGAESPAFCAKFAPLKTLKAFRVTGPEVLRSLPAFATDGWLLDSHVPGQPGGTGARFNWDIAVEAAKLGRPIVLAGGLSSDNVAEAVRRVRSYAVDVVSGVEIAPGRKDPAKLRAFIAAAKGA
jgi:phosphoribosylanthranilate isomerase